MIFVGLLLIFGGLMIISENILKRATIVSDEKNLYVYADGKLHCFDKETKHWIKLPSMEKD